MPGAGKDSLNSLNRRDLRILIFSLLLAFAVWFLHSLGLSYSQTVRVPVTAESSLDGHSLHSSNSVVVVARCRTTGFNLIKLRRSTSRREGTLHVDPSDLRAYPGDGDLFYMTHSELNNYCEEVFGKGTSVEAMISDTVVFRFAVENCKKVPVIPLYTASFRPQYTALSEMRLVPDSVLVYGEQIHLDRIETVQTESFTLSNLRSLAHGEVRLSLPGSVRLSESSVEYSMEVTRYVEIEGQVEIGLRNVPAGKSLLVYPATATVRYRCVFPLSADPSEGVDFYIDYKDFEKSMSGSLIPRVDALPQGVLSYSLEPQVFNCAERVR